jgi:ubiquitin-protein ligase
MKRLAKERSLLDPAITIVETTPEPQTYDQWLLWTLDVPLQDPLPAYTIQLTFSKLYPFREPSIKIPEPLGILDGICCCHASDGTLCVSGFLDAWGPQMTVCQILHKIRQLLVEKNARNKTPTP